MSQETDATRSNPFWSYSLRFYALPGVAELCIALQNRHAADVNVLLFVLWLARTGIRIDEAALERIDRHVHEWRSQVIKPLRNIRVYLKRPETEADPERSALRLAIKKIELESEKIQQTELYRLYATSLNGAPSPSDRELAAEHLRIYQRLLGCEFGEAAIAHLLNAWESGPR